jgi:hypothetical protein
MTVHTHTTRSKGFVARAVALLVAGFFLLHALAHIVGIKDIWGIGVRVSNTTTYLTGLDPHSAAYVALGAVWLAACLLFIGAAAGIVLRRSWWLPVAFAAAATSLVLCVVWLEAAIVGLVVNAVVLAGLVVWAIVHRAVGAQPR